MATMKELYELKAYIEKHFEDIYISPYSWSFYNKEVDWGHKPEGVVRVSDHWNFKSRGEIHCRTKQKQVQDFSVSIGVMENGLFNIVKSYSKHVKANSGEPILVLYLNEEQRTCYIKEAVMGRYYTFDDSYPLLLADLA